MNQILFLFKAVIMGIVEGITEFLPISSTGHMIVVGSLINFNDGFAKNLFEVVIQFGAILAVVVLYRKKIWDSLKHLRPGEYGFNLWLGIVIALVPSVVVALLFYKKAQAAFFKPIPVAFALIVGGIALLVLEYIYRNNRRTKHMENIKPGQSFVVGAFQCISFLWPGFSRSASTIMGGWVVGMTTAAATEFTFFLAIPTMFGASAYALHDAFKHGAAAYFDPLHIAALVIGFIVAFLVALIVVKKFIEYLKKKPLRVFAVYRIIAGIVILLLAISNVVVLKC